MVLSLASLLVLPPPPVLVVPRLLLAAPGLLLLLSGLLTLTAVWLTVTAVSLLQQPTLVTMLRSVNWGRFCQQGGWP